MVSRRVNRVLIQGQYSHPHHLYSSQSGWRCRHEGNLPPTTRIPGLLLANVAAKIGYPVLALLTVGRDMPSFLHAQSCAALDHASQPDAVAGRGKVGRRDSREVRESRRDEESFRGSNRCCASEAAGAMLVTTFRVAIIKQAS